MANYLFNLEQKDEFQPRKENSKTMIDLTFSVQIELIISILATEHF